MREAILETDVTQFICAIRCLSTKEIGATFLVASDIAMNGPLELSKLRKVAKLRGRQTWIPDYIESRLFRRENGDLHLNDNVFRVRHRGSDRLRANLPAAIKELVHERDAYLCTYCGTGEGPFEVDHIHPVSRGGSDDLDNLCLACAPCNRSKSNKTVEEWEGAK